MSPTTGNDGLQAFRVDAGTGALALIDELVLNDSLTEVTLEPTGRFVYVLTRNSDAIEMFRIDRRAESSPTSRRWWYRRWGGAFGAHRRANRAVSLRDCRCSVTNSPIRAFRIKGTSGPLTDLGASGGDGTFTVRASATDLAGRFLYMARVNGGGI